MSGAKWFENADKCKAKGDFGAKKKVPKVFVNVSERVTLDEICEEGPNVSQNVLVDPRDVPLPSESESTDSESRSESVGELDTIESITLIVGHMSVNPKKRGRPTVSESFRIRCEELNHMCKRIRVMGIVDKRVEESLDKNESEDKNDESVSVKVELNESVDEKVKS